MVATKGQAIGLGVVSILTLGAGIAVMVLFHSLFVQLGVSGGSLPALSLFWPYGVPVLITGVLGIVAAAVRNNVAVGIYMGICIVALLVEAGLIVVMAFVLFAYLTVDPESFARDCYQVNGSCLCNDSFRIGYSTCQDPVIGIIHLTRAAAALIIVSWLLMLTGSILSCTACCCGKRTDTPGAIIVQGGGQAIQMGYPGGGGYQHPTGYGEQYQIK
ncbi:uncharacterized protein LOC135482200 isoform X1 [Liolophura sinensis]|uniref:uncharacterized protein LOC135482200 isoform X1 n=1 Tax=Liolophura sinensis TaxID=3198878 RepID=UPI0031588379